MFHHCIIYHISPQFVCFPKQVKDHNIITVSSKDSLHLFVLLLCMLVVILMLSLLTAAWFLPSIPALGDK